MKGAFRHPAYAVNSARARGEVDLLRRSEGGQATYYSPRDALPEIAGCTIAPLREPQQTTVHVLPPLTVHFLPPLTVNKLYLYCCVVILVSLG